MSAEHLMAYGLEEVGTIRIADNQFIVTLTKPDAADLDHCVYAFVVGDEVLRVGSSKGKLKVRLRAWQNDVSAALANKKFRTPQREAAIWRAALAMHEVGQILARQGTQVSTPLGVFNLYLEEESALIGKYQPRCCNDVARHRHR